MDQKALAEAAVLWLPQVPCNLYLFTEQLYKVTSQLLSQRILLGDVLLHIIHLILQCSNF